MCQGFVWNRKKMKGIEGRTWQQSEKKKKTVQSCWIFEVSGSELLQVHLEKAPTSTLNSQENEEKARLKHWKALQAYKMTSLWGATFQLLSSSHPSLKTPISSTFCFEWPCQSASFSGEQAEPQPGFDFSGSREPVSTCQWLCQHGCCAVSYLHILLFKDTQALLACDCWFGSVRFH